MKKFLLGLIGVLVLGIGGFAIFAHESAIDPIAPPVASTFTAEQIARGAQLASAGYCASCHATKQTGTHLSGGRPMDTGFGLVYATNITPDVETGIGAWSSEAFRRAMREGVARDGTHLFPAFPYDFFHKMTDEDIDALYAYLMVQQPVTAINRSPEMPFPLNVRALQAGWKFLFFKPTDIKNVADKSTEWNRGAYLAQSIAHCGACHTPRNSLGAVQQSKAYEGAAIGGWIAPSLTETNPAPTKWTEDEIYAYLRTGSAPAHGSAAGSMGPVVHSLKGVPDADIRALAVYFADVNGAGNNTANNADLISQAIALSAAGTSREARFDTGARRYAAACASCHYNKIPLALSTSLHLDQPDNALQLILFGVGAQDGHGKGIMPAFGLGMSNRDVAELANWLRVNQAQKPAWLDLETRVREVREAARKSKEQ